MCTITPDKELVEDEDEDSSRSKSSKIEPSESCEPPPPLRILAQVRGRAEGPRQVTNAREPICEPEVVGDERS